jgi:hypothetical protein
MTTTHIPKIAVHLVVIHITEIGRERIRPVVTTHAEDASITLTVVASPSSIEMQIKNIKSVKSFKT